MNVNVFGTEINENLRAWSNDQRRVGSVLVLAVAGAILLAGVLTFVFLQTAGEVVYWILAVLLLLLLAVEGAVFALAGKAATPTPSHDGAPEPHYGPSGPSGAAVAPRHEARILTLRCGDCGTEFELTDTGERPMHHVCPGCGLEGVMRDELAPSEAPDAQPHADEGYSAGQAMAEPEPTPPPPPVKKLKLRCGGCREVFSIEDTGERPLRRPCPHCGRVGEVR